MILRPALADYKIVGYFLGKLIIGLGFLMVIPLVIGIGCGEIDPTVDFLVGIALALIIGVCMTALCYTKEDLSTMHAMVVAALAWLAAMFVSAIPLYLSGHFLSYLDACFEMMSGYATTGLSLALDLDHMANAYNFWRHFTMFVGGQGIVVIGLTFLFKGTTGAFKMYLGEARDEKILPNVVETSRFIWMVSIVYLLLGSAALAFSAWIGGLAPGKAIFDAVCVFMAGWDTGGFTPQSQSLLFYHNGVFEMIALVIMLLGSINFALHYSVWTGNRKELWRNIEIITLFASVMITLSLTAWGLGGRDVYTPGLPFFRKVFFHLMSAHTGTGYATIYPKQFIAEWGQAGMFGIILAMAIGGSVCSTTGAIKVFRIGIVYKALRQDIKKLLIPDSAVLIQKIHHVKDFMLEDKHVRASAVIILSYIVLYFIGAIAGMLCGYPLSESLFESTSAAANVGLSCGITVPSMPDALKIVYIFQMWAGRLEFMAIFALGGMIFAAFRGRH